MVTAILVLDYWVIRQKAWKIPDLYKGGPEHIYWYWHGINLRAWAVYIITVIPSLRKYSLLNPLSYHSHSVFPTDPPII